MLTLANYVWPADMKPFLELHGHLEDIDSNFIHGWDRGKREGGCEGGLIGTYLYIKRLVLVEDLRCFVLEVLDVDQQQGVRVLE